MSGKQAIITREESFLDQGQAKQTIERSGSKATIRTRRFAQSDWLAGWTVRWFVRLQLFESLARWDRFAVSLNDSEELNYSQASTSFVNFFDKS